MNWLKISVALAAFAVAGCAAYFSVTGLGILFSGASMAVMIMASSLEFAKLVTASYLKQAWSTISGFLKFYLVSAVVILMIITSAGIFGYLSNAFQQQNLKIQQVDREITVWDTKITTNKEQISIFNEQLNNLQQNQGKLIDLQGETRANSRLLRSVDSRDKQIFDVSSKIDKLNAEIVSYTDTINKIKSENIDIEREVGGFRFVAEAFNVDLNTVVKFFIFLIVFVFDPMAIALVIAFNNLLNQKNKEKIEDSKQKEYKIYGDDPILSENTDTAQSENLIDEGDTEIQYESAEISDLNDEKIEEDFSEAKIEEISEVSDVASDENDDDTQWLNAYNGSPYYTNPNFPWNKKHLWQNDQRAVSYWLINKK